MDREIILVRSGYTNNGVYRIEKLLTEEWEKLGYRISYLQCNGKILYDSSGLFPGDTGVRSGNKFVNLLKRFYRLLKFMNKHRDAAVVALSLPSDCFAAILGLFVRNRVVISERNDPAQYPESKKYRRFRDFCFLLPDVCIFQTEEAMKYFPKIVQKKGHIIPNPINKNIPVFDGIKKEKKIVSAGRLKPQKNYPMLLTAFSKFSRSFPDYTLEIYGDGNQKEALEKLAAELNIEEKVVFNHFCEDIFPKMAEGSMFVMSSNYEGISNSMLEALAIGTPTICTDCPVGGAREMIENNVNGILVPVGDADALCDAMCRVAGDPEFAEMLGNNGKKIREKYPIEKIARQWVDLM